MQSKRFILKLAMSICALSMVAGNNLALACGDDGCDHNKNKNIEKVEKVSVQAEPGTNVSSGAGTTTLQKPQEGFNQFAVLAKLGEVKIVVGELDAASGDGTLDKDQLKKIMSTELAKTSATICGETGDCCAKGSGKGCDPATVPIMYLKLKSVPMVSDANRSAFTINLSLVEKAKVARNGVELMVPVWSRIVSGTMDKNDHSEIDKKLKIALTDFSTDLALANAASTPIF